MPDSVYDCCHAVVDFAIMHFVRERADSERRDSSTIGEEVADLKIVKRLLHRSFSVHVSGWHATPCYTAAKDGHVLAGPVIDHLLMDLCTGRKRGVTSSKVVKSSRSCQVKPYSTSA
jgi:hypothetical protein